MKKIHPADPRTIHEWRDFREWPGMMTTFCGKVTVGAFHFQASLLTASPSAQICMACVKAKCKPESL